MYEFWCPLDSKEPEGWIGSKRKGKEMSNSEPISNLRP